MAELIDGAAVAKRILAGVSQRTAAPERARPPCLATVLVGDDPGSASYVRMKHNRARKVGIEIQPIDLPGDSTTEQVVGAVGAVGAQPGVDGILVQHPLPARVDERAVFDAIPPGKDVDGVTTHSLGAMALGSSGFASCTPAGILRLLDVYDVPLPGRSAVVVGDSPILGLPAALLLHNRGATVTICRADSTDLASIVVRGDVVVAAVEQPEFVKGAWIKPGAVVIDAGYNPGNVGDVEFAVAASRASLITPVPGGVGPMTIAVLLEQTMAAAELRAQSAD